MLPASVAVRLLIGLGGHFASLGGREIVGLSGRLLLASVVACEILGLSGQLLHGS